MARPVHAVDEQDVLPAVGVVVEERAAGAQRFRQQLAAVRAAVVAELQAGRGGDVDEAKAGPAAGPRAGAAERTLPAQRRGRTRAEPAAPSPRQEVAPVHGRLTRPCWMA